MIRPRMRLNAHGDTRIMRVMSSDDLPPTEANAKLVAGFSGADVRTARRYLAGEQVKGAGLREKLAAAVERAKREQRGGIAVYDPEKKAGK